MVGLSIVNVFVGFMVSVRPLVVAPVLDSFMGNYSAPAESLSGLTLNNLGATLLAIMRLDASNLIEVGVAVAAMYIAFSVAIAAVGFGSFYVAQKTRASILLSMMVALHKHLLTLPLAYFHNRKSGDLVSRLSHDVNTTTNYLDTILRGTLQSLSRIAITMFILFKTDVYLTLSVIGLASVHIVITRMLADRVRNSARGLFEKMGVLSAALFETFSGIRLIKSFAAEDYDSARISGAATTLRGYDLRFRLTRQFEEPVRLVADAILIGIILVLAFYAVSNGALSAQAAVMYFYLSQQMIAPVSELAKQALGAHQMLGGAQHILELFHTKSPLIDGEQDAIDLKSSIALENVTYAYEPGQPVLRNVSITIPRGQMVALVGPSGSGKSTLTDLILRFYDPDSGVVNYDGTDIRQYVESSYRKQFGVVAQDCMMFNATLRENIVYNRSHDADALDHAITVANAREFIDRMPKGLDTLVGDRGVRLSGGQRQRISIARAIYSYPSVLVLDEATSALDSESERLVQEAIDRVSREMTVVVIAHRLSTITHADKIVVLNNGMVEATGTHEELLDGSVTYRRLYELQFNEYTGAG